MPQKRYVTGLTNSQLGQVRVRLVPHMPQKRISGGLSNPQLGHFMCFCLYSIKTKRSQMERLDACSFEKRGLQLVERNAEAARHFLQDINGHVGILAQSCQEIPAGQHQAGGGFNGSN